MGSLESPIGYFFADVEGSTERWEKAPGPMQISMARLEALTDELFAQHGGVIQDRAGDGVFAIFKLGNPLQCALEMQLAMQRSDWSSVGGLDLRIGVHAGEDVGDNQVDRVVANRGARIMSSGWGGQIVVSDDAADNFGTPEHAQLRDLGVCRFKGIKDALHLASLVHPALRRTEFPPLRSTLFDGAAAEMLAGPIFGRQAELSEVVSTLSQRRLVTLVGLGGNGKTRLALQVGAEVASSKPVCFASLEALAGPAELPVALASCLGLQLGAGRSADQQIIDYLQDKQMLLVVDNAETVAGRARLLGDIVASCPSISILATSREPLDVQGEALVRIDGLEALTSGSSPALELFAYEARLKDPSFAVREDQLPVFRKITALLEGSPLALRLTAKWINVLSLEQILTRLVQSVELLESPEASDQRQTMRGVFDGSWRFLTPAQQTGLARLSIFIKAFDIAAATKIAEIDLETFADLERKSLLVRTGQGRFAMHAMVREFARERWTTMGAGEEEHVRLTHAKYYLEAVRTVMEGAPVAERGASLEGLRQDYPEIRAAWLHAVDAGANDLLKSTTEPLCYFLYVRSMMREGVEIFGTTIENAALRRHFASIRANFLVHQGDVEAAGVLASSVLTAEEGPELARAHANHVLGNLAHIRGDFEQADARYNAAFDIRESIGDLRGCCFASLSLAALHLLFSRRETARHHIKRGYRLARQIGEPFGMLASHVYAGDLAATENRVEDAQDNYEMSLRLEDSAPHSQFRAMLHRRLGTLFVLRGDPGSALRHHEEAFDLARELGDQRTAAHALIEIGKDWRLVGNIDRALQNLLRGVRFSMTLGIQSCLQRGLLELSQVALMRGDVGGARRLVSVLEDADLGELRTDYEALLVQLAGGESASFAPVTITDLLNELIAEAETDTLKL